MEQGVVDHLFRCSGKSGYATTTSEAEAVPATTSEAESEAVPATTPTTAVPSEPPVPVVCPENAVSVPREDTADSRSVPGADTCYCSVGFTGPPTGPCTACSDCISVVTFAVTLSMTLVEFDTATREAYVTGVAQSLALARSDVSIGTVMELRLPGRRLLASAIEVKTIATVPKSMAASVAASAVFENLSRSLVLLGIPVGAVSTKTVADPLVTVVDPGTTRETPPISPEALTGIVLSIGLILVCITGAICNAYRSPERAYEDAGNPSTPSHIQQAAMDTRERMASVDTSLQTTGFMESMRYASVPTYTDDYLDESVHIAHGAASAPTYAAMYRSV
jgi:hypothetical protein